MSLAVIGGIVGVGCWCLWPLKLYTQFGFEWPYNTRVGLQLGRLSIWRYSLVHFLTNPPMTGPDIKIAELPGDTVTILRAIKGCDAAADVHLYATGSRVSVYGYNDYFSPVLQREYDVDGCAHCHLAEVAQDLVPTLLRPPTWHWRRALTEITIYRDDEGGFTHKAHTTNPVRIKTTWRNFFKRPCSDWR